MKPPVEQLLRQHVRPQHRAKGTQNTELVRNSTPNMEGTCGVARQSGAGCTPVAVVVVFLSVPTVMTFVVRWLVRS